MDYTNCWYKTEEGCIKNPDTICSESCPIFRNMLRSFQNSRLEQKFWFPFALKSIDVDKKETQKLVDIRQNIEQFVVQGKNLLIQSSNCGNGKTCWGIKLLQRQIEKGWKNNINIPPALFVYIPDLLLRAKNNICKPSEEYNTLLFLLNEVPLVLFDDIGCIAMKDYDMLLLSTVIEGRISKGLSSIYTTNLQDDALRSNLGERLYDRIYRLSEVVTFKSKSLRSYNG